MVSVTATIGNYILQPTLLEKHRKTLDLLSATMLWKGELTFFQKLLDDHAPKVNSIEGKKKLDHFQSLILYYNGELVDELRKKLRDHESRLAHMLKTKDELDTRYYKEHDKLMDQLDSFASGFVDFKKEFFEFIEKS